MTYEQHRYEPCRHLITIKLSDDCSQQDIRDAHARAQKMPCPACEELRLRRERGPLMFRSKYGRKTPQP